MARSGGNLGVWGSLVLLGLYGCTVVRAADPVRHLRVQTQTTSSITLIWEAPEGTDPENLTYWVQWPGDGDRNNTRNTIATSITVDGLAPASSYKFSVWVEKDGVNSSQVILEATTAPKPVRNLSLEAQTTTSISLTWEPPESSLSPDLTYWAECGRDGGKTETRDTRNNSVTIDGLEPGSAYECSVWVEANGVNSTRETLRNAATAPNPVINPSLVTRTNHSIMLSWEAPEGPDLQGYTYRVQFAGNGDKNGTQEVKDTSITVENLEAGTSYSFSVWAIKNGISSFPQILHNSTVPNTVMSLRIQDQTNSSITLSWTAPMGPRDPSYTYWISWALEGNNNNEIQDTPNVSITLETLAAGSLYNLTVWAERNEVRGYSSGFLGATAPNEVTRLRNESHTNSSVTLTWDPPDDPYSHSYTYWVQWATEEKPQGKQDPTGLAARSKDNTSESRYEVKALTSGTLYNFSVWAERNQVPSFIQTLQAATAPVAANIVSCVSTSGGYGVILTWSCPPGGYEAFEVLVGSQVIRQDGSSCGKGMSVSDLGPAQSYPATVMTVSNGLRVKSISMTCYTESGGVIAGAIVGILLLFILVGLLIFFLKRRRKTRQPKEVPKDLVFSFPGDIPAKDFADHVRENEKDSNYGFAEEYQQLALEGQGQSQMTASAPENTFKNRYRNVLPYDWSRVPLQPLHEEPGSDYINASFMPGLWSPKEFIATQGPLPHTVSDFWRLVWEQQSHTLVMLTNCMESGRVKCEHYWPLDAQPCTHGQLQVTLINEEVTENWTVRDLQLLHMTEQQTLSVRQFHYVAWPDHGVPYSPDPLLAFQKMLRQWLDQTMDGGPPIVHCSAGVGRTGTLIALDVLLRQLECEGLVGPFSFVKKMRESRPLMVQTEAQYVFLHQCILRSLQKSAPALVPEEVTYENVASLVYENTAAIRARDSEVSAPGC